MKQAIDMSRQSAGAEAGVALPVVLIFLVMMLILGVTAIRNVTLGEKMAGNLHNQQLAFQAAEAGLRYCENALQGVVPTGGTTPTSQAPATPNLWDVEANWADGSTVSVAVPISNDDGLAAQPRCMVEDVANSLELDPTEIKKDESLQAYRITARGVGGTENAVVLLQSYLRFH